MIKNSFYRCRPRTNVLKAPCRTLTILKPWAVNLWIIEKMTCSKVLAVFVGEQESVNSWSHLKSQLHLLIHDAKAQHPSHETTYSLDPDLVWICTKFHTLINISPQKNIFFIKIHELFSAKSTIMLKIAKLEESGLILLTNKQTNEMKTVISHWWDSLKS